MEPAPFLAGSIGAMNDQEEEASVIEHRDGQKLRTYNRVRLLRAEREISREELADALELNHRTVGYIEREQYRVKLDQAYRIANFFGLPLEAVFSQEPFAPMSVQLYSFYQEGSDE